jgi:hypothetical protein
VSAAEDVDAWRPMAFGRRPARAVRDPLMEPLWPGRRVLVHLQVSAAPAVGSAAPGVGSATPDVESAAPGDGTAAPGDGSATPGIRALSASVSGVSLVRIRDEAGLELAGHPDVRAAMLGAARARDLVVDGYLLPLPPLDAPLAAAPQETDVPGVAAATRHLFLGSRSRGGGRADRGATAPPRLGGAGATSDPGVLTFVAVDLLVLDGESLTEVPLLERKRLLDGALVTGELVRLSPHVRLPAANWHRQWRALGFREMTVKDANGRYHPGEPSPDWTIAPIPTR